MIFGVFSASKIPTPPVPNPPSPPAYDLPLAIKDMSKATIVLVTTGGIVPKGNPDRLPPVDASTIHGYNIAYTDHNTGLDENNWETCHVGFDPVATLTEPDSMAPVDTMRVLEMEGVIGSLHNTLYSTVGEGRYNAANVKQITSLLIPQLQAGGGIDAVILTSSTEKCTRVGASIAKAIETELGIPVALITRYTDVAKAVGVSRIVYTDGGVGTPCCTDQATRRNFIETKVLRALTTEVFEPTVFKPERHSGGSN